jgi:hypothetical protein
MILTLNSDFLKQNSPVDFKRRNFVFFAVQYECLNVIYISFGFKEVSYVSFYIKTIIFKYNLD